jgi:hypothetical protein
MLPNLAPFRFLVDIQPAAAADPVQVSLGCRRVTRQEGSDRCSGAVEMSSPSRALADSSAQGGAPVCMLQPNERFRV